MFSVNEPQGTAVLYAGRSFAENYPSTAYAYAKALSGMRDVTLFPASQTKLTSLKPFSNVLLITAIYDGQMEGQNAFLRLFPKLTQGEYRFGILAAGMSPEDVLPFIPGPLEDVPVFRAMGQWLPSRMDWQGKMTLDLKKKALRLHPETVPDWMKTLLEEGTDVDLFSESYLDPLLDIIDGR